MQLYYFSITHKKRDFNTSISNKRIHLLKNPLIMYAII